jgi:hypothetical protein
MKHFRHMMEAQHFIFTDHRLTTYAFQQKWDKINNRSSLMT